MVRLVVIGLAAASLFALGSCSNSTGTDAENSAPRIVELSAVPDTIQLGESATIVCKAQDDDGDRLEYRWSSVSGNLTGSGSTVYFSADACCGGTQPVTVSVRDRRGGEVTLSIDVEVQ